MADTSTARKKFNTHGICAAVLLAGFAGAQAQANQPLDLSACPGLESEMLQSSLRICAINTPCEFILRHRGNCARAIKFLDQLRPTSADIHPDQLWNAAMPDYSSKLYGRPVWQSTVNMVRHATRDATGPIATTAPSGAMMPSLLAMGQFKNGRANGPAYFFYSSGDQYRGIFLDNRLHGVGEYIRGDGSQHAAGFYQNHLLNGPGVASMANGRTMVGEFRDGVLTEGSLYRADATLVADGRFGSDRLILGVIYDESGTQVKSVANSLSLSDQRNVGVEERNCRQLMAEQDRIHAAQAKQACAGTALRMSVELIRLAKERKQLLATQCSLWSEHLRLLWDAEEAIEEAQRFCALWGGKAATDCRVQ